MRHKILYILFALLAIGSWAHAQTLSEQARLSLFTCTPGSALYERYGHTALRVYDPINDIDMNIIED